MRNSLKTLASFLILALTLAVAGTSALAFPSMTPSAKGSNGSNSPTMISLKGTVVETMESGGYTYLCVKNAGEKVWAAIPKTELKVGQEVTLAPGMTMKNFTSKTLNRTFEAIVFSRGLTSAK
jgi:membrane protein implicated in regulation of membrane protease activity